MPSRNWARALFVTACVGVLSLTGTAYGSNVEGHWVIGWSAAVHAAPQVPFLPPPPVFDNQTIRMVVRTTIGGERIRIRFSNEFGTAALGIGAAHIALLRQGASTVPDSDRVLTFGGKPSVSVPPGSPMLSDPVDLKLPAFAELAISTYLPSKTTLPTMHFLGQHETYISGPGDSSAQVDIPNAGVKTGWYFLADVEVWASDQTATIAAFGDSITDGAGAKPGEYNDWPDILAQRLASGGSVRWAVANEGIGGNRVLHDGAGVSALARFDRDVLAKPGVAYLIVMEGINDIGWPDMKPRPLPDGTTPKEIPFAGEVVSADEIIGGLRQIVERAHTRGIKVFGATLTPFEGADYYTVNGEGKRQAINRWIRTSATFDAVFDFDAAVRDPNHPSQFRDGYHSGDHLHPNATGYKAMADAIDISVFKIAVATKR